MNKFIFCLRSRNQVLSSGFFRNPAYHHTPDYILVNCSNLKATKTPFETGSFFWAASLVSLIFSMFRNKSARATNVLYRTGSHLVLWIFFVYNFFKTNFVSPNRFNLSSDIFSSNLSLRDPSGETNSSGIADVILFYYNYLERLTYQHGKRLLNIFTTLKKSYWNKFSHFLAVFQVLNQMSRVWKNGKCNRLTRLFQSTWWSAL